MTPLPNPVLGPSWWQLIQWIANPLQFQDRYSQQYGDVFTMNLAQHGGYVVIGNPQMIQDLFSQDSKFNTGCGNAIAAPLIGQNSLMLMDGDRHKRERKLLMPSFHGERLHTYATQICAIAQHVTDQWAAGQPFIMRTATQHISLELILQIVFGLKTDSTQPSSKSDRYQQIKPLLTQWLDMIDSPLRSSVLFFKFLQKDWGTWSPWGKMKHQRNQVNQLLQAEIDERQTHGNEGQTDMLSLMMAAQDEQGQGMTNEELRDELITILFAGHETVATTLSWALYEIHRQPAVYDKLRHEIESLGDNPAPMDIAQLPYLSAVCQETLRMYPVLPVIFPRISKMPVILAGYEFEANTVLMPSIYLVHYREDLYPNARQFKPERFFERQYSPWEYLPFGGGSRRCLGYALAQLEMKLVLATILSRCELALLEKTPVQPQRRGFTISPKGGVQMVVTATR